ncbi:hypothetical protein UlMin_008069 [Ulmus minor]
MNFSLFSLFLAIMNRFNAKSVINGQGNEGNKSNSSRNTRENLQMVPAMAERWASISSTIASVMFVWAIICQYSPYRLGYISYIQISIREFSIERMRRSEAYAAVEAYLSSCTSKNAKRFTAEMQTDSSYLVLNLDDYERVEDEFRGVRVWWRLEKLASSERHSKKEKRFYVLTFHKRHREIVTKCYLEHVMREGRDIRIRNRQRKLYTNCAGFDFWSGSMWTHIVFKHPASFEMMALDPRKKNEIVEDLLAFSRNKEFYARAGKAWKRGYLPYGPPGTGKSTIVAAMANSLNYDVYDLELTAVKDNTTLRRLLIDTTSKSIIVIEDIDCSLDLTGQREKMEDKYCLEDEKNMGNATRQERKEDGNSSKMTLSGLLNFIDGIWSACEGERLIVFTTNCVEKLDPALIRKGRMDKHIELSFCTFEGFKVLAKNYLNVETHQMFDKIKKLIGETKITPADVAEILTPMPLMDDPERFLSNFIQALEEANEK